MRIGFETIEKVWSYAAYSKARGEIRMHRLRGGRVAAWVVPVLVGVLATAFRLLSKADLEIGRAHV